MYYLMRIGPFKTLFSLDPPLFHDVCILRDPMKPDHIFSLCLKDEGKELYAPKDSDRP